MNLNELFEKYRKKPNENTLTEVLKESQNLIYGIIVKVANHDHDSEDLTQEVLIKVIQNINILPKDTNFGGWLNRTSLNAAINFYHQKQRIKTLAPKIQDLKKEQNAGSDEETIAIIYQHLSQLESTEESLILNKYIHQMTYAQMSSIYQLPKSTLESKINNILRKLKVSIEKAGFAGVALALATTIDQLKASEISINLLPKVKEHFPSIYPKAKIAGYASKVLLKVLVPIAAVVVASFSINHFVSSNQEAINPKIETIKNNEELSKDDVKKEDVPIRQISGINQKEEVANVEKAMAIDKVTVEKEVPALDANKKQNAGIHNEYAGQLINAETKEPIADAKLEIWDIYTYEKTETTTNAEGKYLIPKDLDTTFFFFLKFIKEGYAVKQTFQHFEIHKKISIEMTKGKLIKSQYKFNKKENCEIFIGNYCNLESENYLTANQKDVLRNIYYQTLIRIAPIELYTFKRFKVENALNFSTNEIYELPITKFENKSFVIICNKTGAMIKDTVMEGWNPDVNLVDFNKIVLNFADTGKALTEIELNLLNFKTKEKLSRKTDENGKLPIISEEFLKSSLLTIGNQEYFIDGVLRIINKLENGDEEIVHFIVPYTLVRFDPLTLGTMQAVIGNSLFSRKSLFLKIPNFDGEVFHLYDKFFEELILLSNIKTSSGGIIDIDSEIKSSNKNIKKEITIKIMFGEKLIKNATIGATFQLEKTLPFFPAPPVVIDDQGIGRINIPNNSKRIMLEIKNNNVIYIKKIELDQISYNAIQLNFNKMLTIQETPKFKASILKANKLEQVAANQFNFVKTIKKVARAELTNDSTHIKLNSLDSSFYVENDADYILRDCVFGIKTNYSKLIAVNKVVYSHQNKVEIDPISELDYSNFQLEVFDENGNEINNLNWAIYPPNWKFTAPPSFGYSEIFCKNDIEKHHLAAEFIKEMTVGEEAILKKSVFLINNREYFLSIYAEGYMGYYNSFFIKEEGLINKKIILKKPNSIIFNPVSRKEIYEVAKFKDLMKGDIIYEYNAVRINNKIDFVKAQEECLQEKVSIKLIRDNMPMSLTIPAANIAGLEDNCYNDKEGILTKN